MPASRIRADHDNLAKIGKVFGEQSAASQTMLKNLQSKVDVLRGGDWAGEGAEKFYADMESLFPHLKKMAAALEASEKTVQKISQIMHQGEDTCADIWRRNHPTVGNDTGGGGANGGAPGGDAGGGSSGAGGSSGIAGTIGSIISFLNNAWSLISEGLKDAKGFQGLMKKFPFIKKLGPIADFVSGLLSDVSDPNFKGGISGWARAIAVNAGNAALGTILEVPSLINAGLQLKGTINSWVDGALSKVLTNDPAMQKALQADAAAEKDLTSRIDLGNVTKSWVSTIYDSYAERFSKTADSLQNAWNNPSAANVADAFTTTATTVASFHPMAGSAIAVGSTSAGRSGVVNTLAGAGNLVVGLGQNTILSQGSTMRQIAAASSTAVDALPFSDSFKNSYRDMARTYVQNSQAQDQTLTGKAPF